MEKALDDYCYKKPPIKLVKFIETEAIQEFTSFLISPIATSSISSSVPAKRNKKNPNGDALTS